MSSEASTPVRYAIELGGRTFAARSVRGEEALSTPFRFEVRFYVRPDIDCSPERLVKGPATLVLHDDIGEKRRIDGVVTDVALGATVRGNPEVRLTIEPRLALARHRSDMR